MTGPVLTKQLLDDAFAAVAKQVPVPAHACRLDGHVAHFASTRCVYCGESIRELSADENRLLLGEF